MMMMSTISLLVGLKREVCPGILYYCGQDSEKHAGQLKRIAATSIAMVKWLLTFNYATDNIFYERFIQLPLDDYKKVNFVKHIQSTGSGPSLSSSRQGSREDAFSLLSTILRDHRDPDTGDADPIPLSELLPDKICREKFNQWLQRSAVKEVSLENERVRVTRKTVAHPDRPHTWNAVSFKLVPLQEGEVGNNEVSRQEVRQNLNLS